MTPPLLRMLSADQYISVRRFSRRRIARLPFCRGNVSAPSSSSHAARAAFPTCHAVPSDLRPCCPVSGLPPASFAPLPLLHCLAQSAKSSSSTISNSQTTRQFNRHRYIPAPLVSLGIHGPDRTAACMDGPGHLPHCAGRPRSTKLLFIAVSFAQRSSSSAPSYLQSLGRLFEPVTTDGPRRIALVAMPPFYRPTTSPSSSSSTQRSGARSSLSSSISHLRQDTALAISAAAPQPHQRRHGHCFSGIVLIHEKCRHLRRIAIALQPLRADLIRLPRARRHDRHQHRPHLHQQSHASSSSLNKEQATGQCQARHSHDGTSPPSSLLHFAIISERALRPACPRGSPPFAPPCGSPRSARRRCQRSRELYYAPHPHRLLPRSPRTAVHAQQRAIDLQLFTVISVLLCSATRSSCSHE